MGFVVPTCLFFAGPRSFLSAADVGSGSNRSCLNCERKNPLPAYWGEGRCSRNVL